MLLLDLFVGLLVSTLLTGPVVYVGLAVRTGTAVTYGYAVAVALLALVLGGLTTVLLGWLPVVGVVLSPLVWAGTVRSLTRAEWPMALFVGFVAWALASTVFFVT
ncbi:hypothetical protein [Halomarina oriensis]|uniref:Uncharacterized protein n=1 Tax=Halomarina oriensis TaxID=671145 RepID=A0A6B0GHX7_9EURY|nr:hypothetical protein [Halomarina oriensis]MWG33029.1 hypothetical protein [Halomarina oriensis]